MRCLDLVTCLNAVGASVLWGVCLQVQCTGVVPTVAIDKVDGCQVHHSLSLAFQFVSISP